MTTQQFLQKQKLPYEAKVAHAEIRAWEFYKEVNGNKYNANCNISVGGLDSIVLYLFLRSIGIKIPAVSVSVLEDKSIQEIHKQLNVITVRPLKTKLDVIKEFGFPVISKEKAGKIELLQTPDNPKQTFIHALMTGQMGKQGNYGYSDDLKLQDKWIKLFGGLYKHHRPDIVCKTAPFKVSNKCCDWLKKMPMTKWQEKNNSYPYLGMMA